MLPAEIQNLMNEVKIPLEVRSVEDADDTVGLRRVGAAAEEHIAQNSFIGRARGQRIRTRQVDDFYRMPVLRIRFANLFLDGDTRVVANFLF